MNTPILLLLQSQPSWLEEHALSIIAIALTFLIGMVVPLFVWIVRLGSRVEKVEENQARMDEAVAKLGEQQSDHAGNNDQHVNRQHMKAIDERLKDGKAQMDKLEATVGNGFRDVASRIDKLTDHLIDMKG